MCDGLIRINCFALILVLGNQSGMKAEEVHQQFSVECFNEVWMLLESDSRSREENRLMREMAHASLFHWLRREDCDPSNLSIGLWLVSRVHAVLGDGRASMMYALECISVSNDATLPAFFRGYACEAAARAAKTMKDSDAAGQYLAEALRCLVEVEGDEGAPLQADLDELANAAP
jgi:hypothetical protein